MEKRNVTTAPDKIWNLVYDQDRQDLYVEIDANRFGVSVAVKLKGSDDLRLVIVETFEGA
jgi:hypothetical protein